MRFKTFGISLLVSLSAVAVVLWQYQNIADWAALRNYVPPQKVVQLADSTTMNDNIRRLFYVNHPSLDDKATFNSHCKGGEQTIVLGCYIENRGIYLLDVTDKRLNGVIEVTSAHEALHVAYDRLGKQEKVKVDQQINEAYAGVNDERIKSTVESYRKAGADVTNELHSILGTEVENLPAGLETYYAKYFSNRKKIVGYSKQYEQAFVDLKSEVERDDKQLSSLKNQIESNQSRLDADGVSIDSERKRMDGLLSARRVEEYNNSVAGFNQMVSEYNALVARTKKLISQYNDLVEKRNATATEQQQLYEAIDSNKLSPKQ